MKISWTAYELFAIELTNLHKSIEDSMPKLLNSYLEQRLRCSTSNGQVLKSSLKTLKQLKLSGLSSVPSSSWTLCKFRSKFSICIRHCCSKLGVSLCLLLSDWLKKYFTSFCFSASLAELRAASLILIAF